MVPISTLMPLAGFLYFSFYAALSYTLGLQGALLVLVVIHFSCFLLFLALCWRELGADLPAERVSGLHGQRETVAWVRPPAVRRSAAAVQARTRGDCVGSESGVLPSRAYSVKGRTPEHRAREAQRAACRSAAGRRPSPAAGGRPRGV
jgi:hypothetical protein